MLINGYYNVTTYTSPLGYCVQMLSPKFKRVMKMIVPSLDKENTVGNTVNNFFCISSRSFCCGAHKLLPPNFVK